MNTETLTENKKTFLDVINDIDQIDDYGNDLQTEILKTKNNNQLAQIVSHLYVAYYHEPNSYRLMEKFLGVKRVNCLSAVYFDS